MSDDTHPDEPARAEEPTQPLTGWPRPTQGDSSDADALGAHAPDLDASAAEPVSGPPADPLATEVPPSDEPTEVIDLSEQPPATTQMLSSPWSPPAAYPPHQAASPGPYGQPFGAGGYDAPYPPTASPAPAGARHAERSARLTPGAWVGVGALALCLGLAGGAGGAALMNVVDDSPASASRGLDSVPTRSAAPLEAGNTSVAAVAETLLPSTVQILSGVTESGPESTGSGFVLDTDGHIVTNNHVVAQAANSGKDIVVIDHEGRSLEASLVGRSPVYDLALLSVEGGDLVPAALGGAHELRVGEPVVAFGAPLGLSQTVTSGIVSALNRPVTTGDADNESSFMNAVQTDAAINPGNSGGPLVNLAGEVVGVNSAIATTGATGEGGNIGVGFAVPIAQVKTTVDQILRTGEAQYPIIGAGVDIRSEFSGGGTLTEVRDDSPAQRAGLREGDVITEVGGQRVGDGIALIVAIRTHQPGDTVEVTFERDGAAETVSVVLDGEVG